MSKNIVVLTAVAVAMLASLPAHAGPLSALSIADYDAQNAVNPFTRYGVATIQWGRPNTATSPQVAVRAASNTILASAYVPWAKTTNTLAASRGALLTYSSAALATTGKLGVDFMTNGIRYAKSANVAKNADTLWIRGITGIGASATSVVLVGLQLKLANGTIISDFSTFIDSTPNGAYIGYTDPRLASGFSLYYQFGFFNTYGFTPVDGFPSFEFSVGTTSAVSSAFLDLDPEQDLTGGLRLASAELAGPELGSAELAGFEQNSFAQANAAVPEPASWAMLIGGFALVGGTLRRRRAAFA